MNLTDDTCVKFLLENQAYKVVTTFVNEISGYDILSRILHVWDPHIGGMNGNVQYDLGTLEFKQG